MHVLSFLLWLCTGVLKYQIFAKHVTPTQICMFYETKNAQHKYPGLLSKKDYAPKLKYIGVCFRSGIYVSPWVSSMAASCSVQGVWA